MNGLFQILTKMCDFTFIPSLHTQLNLIVTPPVVHHVFYVSQARVGARDEVKYVFVFDFLKRSVFVFHTCI